MNYSKSILNCTALFFLSSLATHSSLAFDYDNADVSALQSEYRSQLKQQTVRKHTKKTVHKARTSRKANQQELQQYQRLLQKQQTVRPSVTAPLTRQRTVQRPKVQAQLRPRAVVKNNSYLQRPVLRNESLFDAASRGDVRRIANLLNQGINVNAGNAERETALHMAAAKGHYQAVIYLMNHGANQNSRTVNNWLPIHHATRFGHAQIANYLKQRGSPLYAKTSDGLSAVDMARATKDHRILGIFGVR